MPLITPSLTWKVETADRKVYLTFDDGPDPEATPWVLDQLKEHNAKATFFCVGQNVEKFPDTFALVKDAGHTVGNHTFNHLNGWATGNKRYFENIEQCARLVPGNLFRPPYGRIRFSQLRHLRKDYRIIMWDLLTRDFEKGLNTDIALKQVIKNLQCGSVIVFHDSPKAQENLRAMLPPLLSYLREHDFQMERL